jgi:hypothetical protein
VPHVDGVLAVNLAGSSRQFVHGHFDNVYLRVHANPAWLTNLMMDKAQKA